MKIAMKQDQHTHHAGNVWGLRIPTAIALVVGLFAAALAAVAVPGVAFAHASYESSTPAANALIASAPSVVTIHFAEDVNPTGSAIVVYDAKGNQVSTGAGQVDPSDLKTMSIPMTGDQSQVYLVEWHTVSAIDGDPDIGAFTFQVNASTATQQSAAGTSGTSTTTGTTPHATGTQSAGTPAWFVAVIGVLGLLIGGVSGVLLARHRGMPALPSTRAPQDALKP